MVLKHSYQTAGEYVRTYAEMHGVTKGSTVASEPKAATGKTQLTNLTALTEFLCAGVETVTLVMFIQGTWHHH